MSIKTKHSEQAMESLLLSHREISRGNHKQAQNHLKDAKSHASAHVSELKSMGEALEIPKFKEGFEQIHSQLTQKIKDRMTKGAYEFIELQKNVILMKAAPKLEQEHKTFHELHPDDQARITGSDKNPPMFAGGKYENYKYQVNPEGRLQYSKRVPLKPGEHIAPPIQTPNHGSVKTPDMQRPFRENEGVRIDNPAHPMHGKLGSVKLPNPMHPGKVTVDYGKDGTHFVDPSHIKSSKDNTVVKKAMATILEIKSRFSSDKTKK